MISNTADIPLLSGGNITLDTGKSALVLFYHMNSCVQYEASMTWILQLSFVCL